MSRHLQPADSRAKARAFTLVELMVVMAMLTIVVSLASPIFARFMRGRDTDSEVNRFLALTRYARSEAVENGNTMILWMDPEKGAYGLREEFDRDGLAPERLTQANASLKKPDPRQPEFRLAKDLKFELPNQRLLTNGLATIRFAPDGTLEETDLKYFLIKGKDGDSIPICLSRNRTQYELADLKNRWWMSLR